MWEIDHSKKTENLYELWSSKTLVKKQRDNVIDEPTH